MRSVAGAGQLEAHRGAGSGDVAAFDALGHDGDRVVRVQALVVGASRPEVQDSFIGVERRLNPAAGVLAEHQVAAVEARKSLLVLTLDRGLHRGLQRVFNLVDQFHDREHLEARGEAHTDLGRAALAVRRGQYAFLAAQPFVHLLE